jgi:hypothetical protein
VKVREYGQVLPVFRTARVSQPRNQDHKVPFDLLRSQYSLKHEVARPSALFAKLTHPASSRMLSLGPKLLQCRADTPWRSVGGCALASIRLEASRISSYQAHSSATAGSAGEKKRDTLCLFQNAQLLPSILIAFTPSFPHFPLPHPPADSQPSPRSPPPAPSRFP